LSARRAILLMVFFAPLAAGCYGTHHVPFDGSTGLESATGVTLRSGEEIEFMATGATITNDSLHAVTKHDHIAIPTDSIARISVRKFSPLRTGGLVIGVAAVTVFTFLAVLAYGLGQIN
jgi:hypothetical protein